MSSYKIIQFHVCAFQDFSDLRERDILNEGDNDHLKEDFEQTTSPVRVSNEDLVHAFFAYESVIIGLTKTNWLTPAKDSQETNCLTSYLHRREVALAIINNNTPYLGSFMMFSAFSDVFPHVHFKFCFQMLESTLTALADIFCSVSFSIRLCCRMTKRWLEFFFGQHFRTKAGFVMMRHIVSSSGSGFENRGTDVSAWCLPRPGHPIRPRWSFDSSAMLETSRAAAEGIPWPSILAENCPFHQQNTELFNFIVRYATCGRTGTHAHSRAGMCIEIENIKLWPVGHGQCGPGRPGKSLSFEADFFRTGFPGKTLGLWNYPKHSWKRKNVMISKILNFVFESPSEI